MQAIFTTTTLAAWAAGLAILAPITAQHEHGTEAAGHSHAAAESHDGAVTMTKDFHFEVVMQGRKVLVYVYDGQQAPVDPKQVTGSLRIAFKDRRRKPADAKLGYVAAATHGEHEHEKEHGEHEHEKEHGEHEHEKEHGEHEHEHEHEHEKEEVAAASEHHHPAVGYLAANVDLRGVAEGAAKLTIKLAGLNGKTEKDVAFKETFRLARVTEYVCPMKCTPPVDDPGKCVKCGMTLKARKFIYDCPMHPTQTSREAGAKCARCGMTMVKQIAAAEAKAKAGHDHGDDGDGDGHGEHKEHKGHQHE